MFVSTRMSCVVNRVEGMIPEVVGLRGVDDYARTGSDCTKVTRKTRRVLPLAREVFRYGPLIVRSLSLYQGEMCQKRGLTRAYLG